MENKRELDKVAGLGHVGKIRQEIPQKSVAALLWPLPQTVIPVRSPGRAEYGPFPAHRESTEPLHLQLCHATHRLTWVTGREAAPRRKRCTLLLKSRN